MLCRQIYFNSSEVKGTSKSLNPHVQLKFKVPQLK